MPKQLQPQKQENVTKKEEKTAKKDMNVPKKCCPAVPQHTMTVDDSWIENLRAVFNTEKVVTTTEQKGFLFGPNPHLEGISLAVFMRTKIFDTAVESYITQRDAMLKNSSCPRKIQFSRKMACEEAKKFIQRMINSAVNTSRSFFKKEIVSLLETRIGQNLATEFEEYFINLCKQEDRARYGGVANVKEEVPSGKNDISDGSESEPSSDEEAENAPKMSEELRLKIQKMYASLPPQHELVYPPLLPPGTLRIPIGGFAKCQCKEGCEFELPEPAYRILSREELAEFWLIISGKDTENIKSAKSFGRKGR
ncbi:hypothetical protein GCK72_025408 [Caenorhabditis remanei]|uniref:Uncharacterized protein n=1 Tax=Caenorhabditis remanei TaxID=31234 RepID=A0A6A5G2F5_CAERE|nr:hypothetical protein GCK72_025408 [Caenorhabditis remanei]KAF1748941.1 hypothetical protein GCK72_025408 [Caenorhabditis remanei]